MTIILRAFSPGDGMAIVDKDRRLRLIRPPYMRVNTIELPVSAIQDAVLNHGFHASDKPFVSWESVIGFLNRQLIEYRQNQGNPVLEMLNPLEILDVAPLEVLQGFLSKVENELIAKQQFEHANNFLVALLESSASQEHPDLKIKAVKLLKKIKTAEEINRNAAKVLESKYSPFQALNRKQLTESANSKAEYI
ncbi:MAG: hypothetical protein ACRERS_11010, partial [Methylococcales bacterium]